MEEEDEEDGEGREGRGGGGCFLGRPRRLLREKERKKEQKDVQTAERMKTQSIKEDLLCK